MTEKTIPHTWSMASLCDLGEWRGGGTPSKLVKDYWNGNIPWVSPKDMKQDSIFDSADHITKNAVDDSATKLIPPDSILCVTRSGILAHTFPVAITMVAVTVNQDIKALTPSKGIDPRYLAWALRAEGREILETCSKDGTTVNSIESSRLYAHRVPVAPQREQLRIVARIEELFSELDIGIESLKIAREQTNIYRQSVLKQAFEGKLTAHWRTEANTEEIRSAPTIECSPSLPQSTAEIHTLPSLPSTWHWSKLGDVADITGGLTKNPARNHFPRRVKYLRVANVYADSLNLAEIHEIGVTDAELDRVLLQHGDLLIVEGNGSIDQIGRVAAWGGEIPECAHQNHIIKARPRANVRTRYLLHFLLSKVGRDLIMRVATSTSGLHTLSVTKVSNLRIPLTCVEEQEQILLAIDQKLSVAEKFIEEIDRAIVACEVLRRSILKRAFSGELSSQDPKDEPACALLGRIKTERADKDKSKKKNGRRNAA